MNGQETAQQMAGLPNWYLEGSLSAIGELSRQGLSGEQLRRAWRAYEAGAPKPTRPPTRLLLPPFTSAER